MRREAFETMLRKHQDAVYRQMVRTCRNQDDAEEVLSEAMLRAYQACESLENPAAFKSWLTTIGQRICFSLRKSEKARPILSLVSDDIPSLSSQTDEAETKQCILAALDSLSPALKSAYELHIAGNSPQQIAATLGISYATARARISRAQQKIRSQLQDSLIR
jgi:RNA polymerase sigma-70 factor (ECF subfamily)